MAIYTRYGGKIKKVISAEQDKDNHWWLKCEISYDDGSPGAVRECSMADLRADGGFEEIRGAIKNLKPESVT